MPKGTRNSSTSTSGSLGSTGRLEPAALVVFLVSGQVLFGHDSQDRPVEEHDRAVVQTVADGYRRAHDHQLLSSARCACDLAYGPAGGLQEHGLGEQVGARVARDAELGKHHQIAVGGQSRAGG